MDDRELRDGFVSWRGFKRLLLLHLLTVVNMARRRGASARTVALTKAQEAVAQRDAERIRREKQLEAVLADYYLAQGEVARIHRDADAAAAPFETQIGEAVRSLDRLGETRAGIAGLTGLPVPQVRDYLADLSSKQSGLLGQAGSANDRIVM